MKRVIIVAAIVGIGSGVITAMMGLSLHDPKFWWIMLAASAWGALSPYI